MSIWKNRIDLEQIRKVHADCAVDHLGIEFTGFGDDWMTARMPVDARTRQPFGILHGGASVLLAETVGSMASYLCIDSQTHYCVGLDINANHLRSVRDGWVEGKATPLHIGRSTHVWQIMITDSEQRLICVCRLTMSILSKPARL
jgi:1,4-dihydroxy-2-naphthoyl-CoA hydrolase